MRAFTGCWAALVVVAFAFACGGSTSTAVQGAGDDGGASASDDGSATADASDSGATTSDGGSEGATDPNDGPPSYTSSCTPLSQQTGTICNTFHGRLDGYLRYVVAKGGSHSCNGDSTHVHLQIEAQGNIYDVAVDIGMSVGDVLFYEEDHSIPIGPWAEGWHGTYGLDYTSLGLHSGQGFTPQDPTTLGQKIQSELAGVNHIAVFGEGYMTGNGAHDVHYVGHGNDGAIVIHPLEQQAHLLLFHFSTQSF